MSPWPIGWSKLLPCSLPLLAALALVPRSALAAACGRTITADVVALDQPLMFNRLGAQNVNGIIYALERDVVSIPEAGQSPSPDAPLHAGKVMLRPDKRPRPLVLRVAAGDCLQVNFTNLLNPYANAVNPPPDFTLPKVDDQVASRWAGFHVQGMQVVTGLGDDASFVGKNGSNLVLPGDGTSYLLHAEHEGTFLVTSHGATFGGEGFAGNTGVGMFAVVNVEPAGASFYRSQVTEEELRLATRRTATGEPMTTATGQPIIDYAAVYPATIENPDGTTVVDLEGNPVKSAWALEGKAGLPVLAMLQGNQLVHSDLTAIITGPAEDGSGRFPPSTYPLESQGLRNPTVPNRLEPFREYTIGFHDEMAVSNAFPRWYQDPVLGHTLHALGDVFMINYGSGGVGSEVIASRLGVGPMHDCLDCVYEEFFLTSYAVGDPAMVVDKPANVGLEDCAPSGAGCTDVGPKAKKAFYPDDPSNVYHSYINDFVKFRNVHTGSEHHVFHLHNHQWLFNPSDDNSNYLDAQGIGPGGGYTYEINFGGSGNRNKSAGDAIFHCHFYPHFAQGMWAHWRNHDVFEAGTPLLESDGTDGYHTVPYALRSGEPAEVDAATKTRARALPDGEIAAGTPIPAIVPLPGKPMAVMPARVTVVPKVSGGITVGSVAKVDRTDTDPARIDPPLNPTGLKNPGYPFWVAGIEEIVGQRAPTPPLDMVASAGGWDGGLPRHALDGYAAAGCADDRTACAHSSQSHLDMTKEITKAKAVWFPEEGTDVEKAVMAFHATREHPSASVTLDGTESPGSFITNGSGRPKPGAPYHDPCVDDTGHPLSAGYSAQFFSATGLGSLGYNSANPFNADTPRVYKGANIQFDAVLNKLGYHFPQQRIVALWGDALDTIMKKRPAEPLVMRMNTFDCAMYQHTNLVPGVYELDDYQVRTTTDIIGQHIHLPKWDLTTTDGSANGWNYEDGTLSPDSVRERIHAINAYNPSGAGNPADSSGRPAGTQLQPQKHPFFPASGPGKGVNWLGARTTLQRWFSDPIVNVDGIHRGLGIVFTHDHYGPSTHQQVGLYATVLTEPPGSTWKHNETGELLGTRDDGGPTSWQAAIIDGANSHREFYFEYSDFQHAYRPGVYVGGDQWGGKGSPPTADTFRDAVNPSFKKQASAIADVIEFPELCPGGGPRPCPEGITADDPGFMVVNYRNEPVGFRVFDPSKLSPADGKPGAQADGRAGDLAYALQSRTDRKIPELNGWPAAGKNINGTIFPPPINAGGLTPGDPFTPMVRAYFGDLIRIKIQAGGHEESHNATVNGAKWLQAGSGFGFAPNSGWRNSQHAGISEQFTFAAPALPSLNSGLNADHLYSMNASIDGFWNGVWGIFRNSAAAQKNLVTLPNNSTLPVRIANRAAFRGVCPATAPTRSYDVSAVLANDVLENALGVKIVPADASATMHAGAALNPSGGTLVYNPRPQTIQGKVPDANGAVVTVTQQGPLHDPTAILYVMTSDLVARDPKDLRCINSKGKLDPTLPACPVRLRPTACAGGACTPGAPVEPIVFRATAGDCMSVVLRNRLPAAGVPDLAGYKHLPPIVVRDRNAPGAVTTFNNNLIRPSNMVGLHPALVSYDVNKDDGVLVGVNGLKDDGAAVLVAPGKSNKLQWYAGDLSLGNPGATTNIVATPVEYGGANVGPADVIKQGQKGLGGAIVIEPAGSTWAEGDLVLDHQANNTGKDCASTPAACRATRQSATVNGTIRDLTAVLQKGMNHRYADGAPVEMVGGEGAIAEDSEDSGHMSLNYGTEPMWFRFGVPPHSPTTAFGAGVTTFAEIGNAHAAYSNGLAGGDPATPVFTAPAGAETRLHLLHPTGSNRASGFTLHGHVWQRAPYVCPSSAKDGLPGKCLNTGFYPTAAGNEVGSRAIGVSPVSFYMGAQDLVAPGSHFELLLPSAGGSSARPGDYLFMDRAAHGTISGLWSLLRVK